MLEIDVDVGRLAALGRDEALEQQVEARRVDRGDAEAVADRRIGRRAAPLAEDVLRAGEADDVVHGEEIGRVAELGDQRELVVERGAHAVGNAVGIARPRAGLGEGFERRLRRRVARAQFFRVAVGELVEAEGDPVEEADRLFHRVGRLDEQARHLFRPFEMALGIGLGQQPGRRERRLLADAGDDVGERPPLGIVHEDVVDRQKRRVEPARRRRALGEAAAHVGAVSRTRADPQPAGEGFAQLREARILPSPLAGEGKAHDLQPLRALQQLVETQMALAFRRAQIALAEQPAEPPVGGAILRIDEDIGRAVDESEPRPGDDAKRAERLAVLARVDMRAHHASERVAVGDADPRQPERGGARDQLLRMRRAAQEREIRRCRQLGVAAREADHRLPLIRPADAGRLLPQAGEGFRPLSRLRERVGVRASRVTMAGRKPLRSSPARFRARSAHRGSRSVERGSLRAEATRRARHPRALRMLRAVDFDDQPMLDAKKVSDVKADRRLSAELTVWQSPIA